MPTKMAKKLASRISRRSSSSSARSRLASVVNSKGRPRSSSQVAELAQEGLQRLAVADEVVVHEVHVAAVADGVQGVELAQHLLGGLGPRHPAVQLDDVAELAVEGASAGVLHPDVQVVVELEQVEAGNGGPGDVGEAGRGEGPLRGAALEGGHEVGQDLLGLAQDQEVGGGVGLRGAGDVRAADHDRLARARGPSR